MAVDDESDEKPTREREEDDAPLAGLRDAIAAGLDDAEHGRTSEGRDAIRRVRARRVYCKGCHGAPMQPVHDGEGVWCALHPYQGALPRGPAPET